MDEREPTLVDQVIGILREEGYVDGQIGLNWSLRNTLDLDSVDIVAIATILEQRFLLPTGVLHRVHAVDSVKNVVLCLRGEGICSESLLAYEMLRNQGFAPTAFDQPLSDLGLTSIDYFELIHAVEQSVGAEISDYSAQNLRTGTVQDLAILINQYAS